MNYSRVELASHGPANRVTGTTGQSTFQLHLAVPAGSYPGVVREVLGEVCGTGLVYLRVSSTSLTLKGAGDAADFVARLARLRNAAWSVARSARRKVASPSAPAGALDVWSASVLRAEHADALLAALAGLVPGAGVPRSPMQIIARRGSVSSAEHARSAEQLPAVAGDTRSSGWAGGIDPGFISGTHWSGHRGRRGGTRW